MKYKYLVVDTAALVKNVPLWEYGEQLYSVPEVTEEIRDKQTREHLQAMPVAITMRQPQAHSIKFMSEFSKKTGDYASLSLADLKVLALTYELEVESRGGAAHLRSEPLKIITEGASRNNNDRLNAADIKGFYYPPNQASKETSESNPLELDPIFSSLCMSEGPETGNNEDESDDLGEPLKLDVLEPDSQYTPSVVAEEADSGQNHDEVQEQENMEDQPQEDSLENDEESYSSDHSSSENVVDDDDDDDDDDGWITPSSLKRSAAKKSAYFDDEDSPQEDHHVVCITSDFAVQNVLKHIGLAIMGVDGKIIKHLKSHILRCHACYKTTSVMTKIFCPHCGNKTLKKVSVSFNPDGTQRIWINTRRPISTKGTKFSLPTPKGGKHGRNPLLVGDQREAKRFSSKMSKKKVNPLHEDYNPDQTPFAVRDVYSRAAQLGYIGGKNHYHYYWEKKNPNEPAKKSGKRKKQNVQ